MSIILCACASFVKCILPLAGLGIGLGLLPEDGRDLILAGAILSILINPLLFFALDRLGPHLEARERGGAPDSVALPVPSPELPVTRLRGHAVLVGYGQVGSWLQAGRHRAR